MGRFPQEPVFALAFGAVMLVQCVLKHLRKRGLLTEVEAETEAEERPERNSVAQLPGAAEALQPAQAMPTHAAPASPRAAPAPMRREARRFSRRSLMGGRRAVQEAIVIAAMLGPRRAYQPHDID